MHGLMPSVGCVGVKPVVLKGFSGGRSLLATRLPGYTSCGTCMTSIVAENRTIGRFLSIVDKRILRGSGRRSMAFSVVARCEQTSTHFTADVFLEKITAKISSIRDATATAPPSVHLPPAIVSPPSEKSQVLSCACSSWLLLRKPVNLTRCLHS